MRKPKSITSTDTAAVAARLDVVTKSLAKTPTLTPEMRKAHRDRMRVVPAALVARVLKLARLGDGMVAGLPFDPAVTQATLDEVALAREAAVAARDIANVLDDAAMTSEAVIGDHVFAIYQALRRLVNTPAGKTLGGEFEEMAKLVREQQKPKRTKREALEKKPRS